MIESAPRRLNYGCGWDKREGYLNVDSDPACEPDVLVVDNDLSVLRGEPFAEILALDVLEHVPRTQSLAMLLEWADLLDLGGGLTLKTSSILGVAEQLAQSPAFSNHYAWTLCLFGTQAHPGDFHHTGFTEVTLRVHLAAAGFHTEQVWVTDGWLLHAEASKASDWSTTAAPSDASDDEFVRTVYAAALMREPDDHQLEALLAPLAASQLTRRQAALQVWSSPERLFVTARELGLEPDPAAVHPVAAPRRTLRGVLRSVRARTSSHRTNHASATQ